MWRNLEEELKAKTKLLAETGYPNTVKWLNRILKNKDNYRKHPEEFKLDYGDMVKAFEIEFLSRTDYGVREIRKNCLQSIQMIFERAISKGKLAKKAFEELRPFAERGIDVSKTITEVVNVFDVLDESSIEARIYGALFVFILNVEGQYLPIMRILCALKLVGEDVTPNFEQIEQMKIRDIKKTLGSLGTPLFEVYERDGKHLRNSIAHAHFKYTNGTIACWDVDQKSQRVNWNRKFTFESLSAIMGDIYSVPHAYLYWYLLRELVSKIFER
jgi:ribosomal protein S17